MCTRPSNNQIRARVIFTAHSDYKYVTHFRGNPPQWQARTPAPQARRLLQVRCCYGRDLLGSHAQLRAG